MISLDFKNKIVLVTGGGRGIGLAISRSFAEGELFLLIWATFSLMPETIAGATLVITYTSTDATPTATALSKEFNVPVHVYHCPGEQSETVNSTIDLVAKDVGEVDIVVANAGVSLWREALDMTDTELDTLMQTNLFAPYYLSRALMRHWLDLPTATPGSETDTTRGSRDKKVDLQKKILFVSSISGIVAMKPQAQSAYNASKAGLTMLAKSLAGEWAKYGVSVNSISPGYVYTDMIANPPPGEEEWVKTWQAMTPVDRFAQPKEIGDMVVLLCSDRASHFMTGSDVVLDGGESFLSIHLSAIKLMNRSGYTTF
ncbi:hypothetical protein P7C73_g5362, partial [Tremellales sp. Uapishka_1]